MNGILQITRRELSYLLRRPRHWILLLIVPMVLTILTGLTYSEGVITGLRVGVWNQSPSQISRELIRDFDESEVFDVTAAFHSQEDMEVALRGNEVDGVLLIPSDFSRMLDRGETTTVVLGANAVNMSIGSTFLTQGSEIVSTLSGQIAVKKRLGTGMTRDSAITDAMPLQFAIRPWYNPTRNIGLTLVLGYAISFLQQVLMYYTSTAINREPVQGPARDVILEKLLAYQAVGTVSLLCVVGGAIVLFGIPCRGSFLLIVLLSILFVFAMSAVGILLSALCHDALMSTTLGVLIAIPSLILSGFVWPVLATPWPLKIIAYCYPFRWYAVTLRTVILAGAGFPSVLPSLLKLLLLGVICAASGILILHKQSPTRNSIVTVTRSIPHE